MRITIRPSLAPDREIDVTPALVGAVAYELWKHHGGNDVLNWLEAERLVARLAGESPGESARRHARAPRGEARARKPRRGEADRVTGPIPYL